MNVFRYHENPLIKVEDVKPTREDFIVIGAFNAGVTKFNGQTVMLIRVAEMPKQDDAEYVKVPLMDEEGSHLKLVIKKVRKDLPGYDFSDPRVIKYKGQTVYLTSISHLRLAKSSDGIHFQVEEKPTVFPETKMESWGIEDCRITQIEDTYYITYSAVSSKGVGVGLLATENFRFYTRKGIILAPENKDVVIFPEKINGNYFMMHRPVPGCIGTKEIWTATSQDLIRWGDHCILMECREGSFDSQKIGAGSVPIKTPEGWLTFYHGVDENERYCMGAALLDLNNPSRVIARSSRPILEPVESYEVKGFFGNVVFSCGTIVEDRKVKMYYGAADERIACAEFSVSDVLESMAVTP
ncbi:MAG TPA: glycoside hydrolase family 130 protein [Bacillales bacterium]|nr:glycoside hydrolase family 130 protein [Bacillales bacterium]